MRSDPAALRSTDLIQSANTIEHKSGIEPGIDKLNEYLVQIISKTRLVGLANFKRAGLGTGWNWRPRARYPLVIDDSLPSQICLFNFGGKKNEIY